MPMINFFKEENLRADNQEKQERDRADKKYYKKELLSLLNGLPDHIIEHYITLVKLERQILKENQV